MSNLIDLSNSNNEERYYILFTSFYPKTKTLFLELENGVGESIMYLFQITVSVYYSLLVAVYLAVAPVAHISGNYVVYYISMLGYTKRVVMWAMYVIKYIP